MAAICQVGSWIFQSQNFQLQTRSRGHNAKFMAIYLFFQQGGTAILDFLDAYWDTVVAQ